MPTIEENKFAWDKNYDWKDKGDEWSLPWGGTDMLWYAVILPRIHLFVPTPTILEIAPGFGRFTQFLARLCNRVIVVDLSEKCIEACKRRFKDCSHIDYHVNDGKSLEMINESLVDFVFSFDSLVHAKDDVIEAYLNQLAKKLRKNGVGFMHHSNMGEYAVYFRFTDKLTQKIELLHKWNLIETNRLSWRSLDMTAQKFREYVEEAGLQCISQEIINWPGKKRLVDCISVFTTKDSLWLHQNKIMRNKDFMRMADYVSKLSQLYGKSL